MILYIAKITIEENDYFNDVSYHYYIKYGANKNKLIENIKKENDYKNNSNAFCYYDIIKVDTDKIDVNKAYDEGVIENED